jgi:biopolymer transport protein ExbB/TolQ
MAVVVVMVVVVVMMMMMMMMMMLMMLMFWVLALCRLGRCQRFGETSSALKMETVCFSETLASTDESTWSQNLGEHHHLIIFLKDC